VNFINSPWQLTSELGGAGLAGASLNALKKPIALGQRTDIDPGKIRGDRKTLAQIRT